MVSDALNSENNIISPAQQQILKRLQKLQASMVGGERAGDSELKEKRLRKKRNAERRLKKLAQVLARVDGEDKEELVLGVYDDIQEELRVTLRKHKTKVRGLEREISDLQSEFESERTDYLETIRRQEHQIKLYQQILDKILPTLKKECNYSNIERIKSEAEWCEDSQSWLLPDLITYRTKLPPAGPLATADAAYRNRSSGGGSEPSVNGTQSKSPDDDNCQPASFSFQKLQQSEEEDFAGNYFKPKRATELLIRAHEDASKAFGKWKENTPRIMKMTGSGGNDGGSGKGGTAGGGGGSLNSSLNQNGFHTSFNSLNANPVMPALGSSFLNSSWNGSTPLNNTWIDNGFRISPEIPTRRPLRLEALPVTEKKTSQQKTELNTLDVI